MEVSHESASVPAAFHGPDCKPPLGSTEIQPLVLAEEQGGNSRLPV
jgi:hypothetical protein